MLIEYNTEDHYFDKDDICEEFFAIVDSLAVIDYDINEIFSRYKYARNKSIESLFSDVYDSEDADEYFRAIEILFDRLDSGIDFIKRKKKAISINVLSIVDENETKTYGRLCIKVTIGTAVT